MSTHLDARDPLVIDTHELARQAGALKELHDVVEAPADLGIEVIGVPEGAPMRLDLNLESVVEGVLVVGTVQAPLAGECSRCLEPVTDEGVYQITELYNYPGREAADDEFFLEDDLLDLEPAVRAAVVLELPFSPLCRPDCKGLCPRCGANLNENPGHAHEDDIDPRWSGLAGFGGDGGD
ncbi:YceD family protein [uncultured Propionibacterium sp.]|uniref:YceD family protein n=1 Tax=uncultured Propionibacterium sp. TaxID=218066 RepID=UPI00292FAC0D|nr:YceD family protein [uncultured Propionibacterium sp.]